MSSTDCLPLPTASCPSSLDDSLSQMSRTTTSTRSSEIIKSKWPMSYKYDDASSVGPGHFLSNALDTALEIVHRNHPCRSAVSDGMTMATDVQDDYDIDDLLTLPIEEDQPRILTGSYTGENLAAANMDHHNRAFQQDVLPHEAREGTEIKWTAPFPTPIAPLEMRVVNEIAFGSVWSNQDDATTDLVKLLFIHTRSDDRSHHVITDSSCNSVCSDEATENQGRPVKVNNPSTTRSTSSRPMNADTWESRLEELVKFRKQYGTCLVPNNWKGNRPLAQWVKRQRYQAKRRREGLGSTLTDDRMQALDDIGFVWSSQDSAWDEKFYSLQAFARVYGHCNVPSRYPANPKLSVWVRCQRRQFKLKQQQQQDKSIDLQHQHPEQDELTADRFSKLLALGFNFNPRNLKSSQSP
jgi:Helicase associated domain